MLKAFVCSAVLTTLFSLKAASQLTLPSVKDGTITNGELRFLPQNFYNQHLGFFCKKEDQLQKHTRLNLFFRLGSKTYVDYLERKPNVTQPF